MGLLSLFVIAMGLSMDAFAVSVSNGAMITKIRFKDSLKIACFFGFFQGLMPALGWAAGIKLADFISGIDHWLAFALLTIIGLKMICTTFKECYAKGGGTKEDYNETTHCGKSISNNKVLLLLAVATSIDALAVGVSLAFLKVSIVECVVVIAFTTFLISFLGIVIGNKFGGFLRNKSEIAGGLTLIAIGLKILIQHTFN
jgi:manganese efflux pump family protein